MQLHRRLGPAILGTKGKRKFPTHDEDHVAWGAFRTQAHLPIGMIQTELSRDPGLVRLISSTRFDGHQEERGVLRLFDNAGRHTRSLDLLRLPDPRERVAIIRFTPGTLLIPLNAQITIWPPVVENIDGGGGDFRVLDAGDVMSIADNHWRMFTGAARQAIVGFQSPYDLSFKEYELEYHIAPLKNFTYRRAWIERIDWTTNRLSELD